MDSEESRETSLELAKLIDLATPFAIRVAVTLRLPELIAGGTTEIGPLASGPLHVARSGSGTPLLVLHHDIGTLDTLPFYESLAREFTVLVPSQGSVTVAFDAVNPGKWALHCHHLYHMIGGMMTAVEYKS